MKIYNDVVFECEYCGEIFKTELECSRHEWNCEFRPQEQKVYSSESCGIKAEPGKGVRYPSPDKEK